MRRINTARQLPLTLLAIAYNAKLHLRNFDSRSTWQSPDDPGRTSDGGTRQDVGSGRLDDAARAGWLYYVAGNTQDQIAAKLGVSRQSRNGWSRLPYRKVWSRSGSTIRSPPVSTWPQG